MISVNTNLISPLSKLFVVALILLACSDPFSTSPFEAKVRREFRNTTQDNLRKIGLMDTTHNQTFKIALIADAHYHLNSLADAITDIQRKNDFAFIIVVGDLTENGLLKEYEIFHSIMAQAGIPYLTVIGNHDYLSNGSKIYEQMFGPFNYSFAFKGVKFIVWDNVIWESEKEADYEWLEEALNDSSEDGSTRYGRIIPFSHIPPSDQQFEGHKDRFHALLKQHNIALSVHGHKHEFSVEKIFEDEIQFLTVGSPQLRSYTELIVTADDVIIKKITY